MLTRLREIVEKVASAPRLNEALDILVTDVCQAMETEVCSVYLADNDRRCYYLMATRGLKKPRGRTVALAFDEGLVGLVGRLAEPINLADAQKHPSFKYIPAVKEDRFRAFLGVPIIQRRQLLGVLVVQQRELRQFDESEESFLVTLATQMAAILSQSQLNALFGQYRQTRIRALPASSGVAIAEGWMDVSLPLMEQVYEASTLDTASERERLTGALEEAANEFRRYSKRYAAGAQKETAAIFDLYSHLLSDARLRRELFAEVDKGAVAEWAVKKIIEKFAEQFAALSDGYLKERAGDLRTLGQRLLFHLDDSIQGPNTWPARIILVADELSATTLAEVPQDRLAGVVVRDGAANSHAAIMVRALGIPTVMGADIQPSLLHGHMLIVDGYRGELLVDPEPVLLQEYQRLISEENELSRLAEDDLQRASELKSGERVKVMLNAGLSPEHEEKLGSFVDGIGLYRTEIPFMLQSGFPSEEEQVAQYQGMLQMFNSKPVTLRTLDIGADKQLPYMPISEENPCLGWRGIRITLDQPEIFLIQVRAMLRANAATGNLSILLPMVTSLEEVDEARRLIDRASREVEEMIGYAIPRPRLGVMLEVPSMVFMLPQLASRIDFISVGTNDLTQYLLAVDRNNTRVASMYDSLHPAVLRALAMIAHDAERFGIDLRLCGEMAGDPMCVTILIGLGYRHLSMNGRSVARVKYLLRRIDIEEAQELSRRSLEAQMTAEVRHQVAAFMERRGLGGLIRGGR
ncbi:TPA: phosphoenolpyruvate--protein phosphotransferase [Klebsiella quasipneumoniae subsp. quasipneumoniae]|uniref:phosphoenolpyruvate--protein phosphotransferase n=1 Tax=Klebsiella quasipneumoniae TaxID=1463165 RepID=UPI000A0F26C4|nr:phosphoenolpyruvate--protein phosphotransferase [Klebsiella quasipneumoniae]HBR1351780.1 phosphoenolpyruvate--protein phosphotransferase [Klebsiella quasipneumoniae subsp. quasipneumoniae]MCU8820537.1 phosphoenolpyruvate--protein phosphotransferase [Klebsiella quasipneumoniae]MDH1958749.1 phosphoenolpyruvate--protein phosphotransferase [Klebsiella quasipneumoniae]QYD22348.1 phosphoenolpyruvate--protein phosphotransferase [Klebsiella quasipneumoniae]SMG72572.1 phosphocarrier protein kinase/p